MGGRKDIRDAAAVADKFAGSLISFYRRDTLAKAPALYTNGTALSWEPQEGKGREREDAGGRDAQPWARNYTLYRFKSWLRRNLM